MDPESHRRELSPNFGWCNCVLMDISLDVWMGTSWDILTGGVSSTLGIVAMQRSEVRRVTIGSTPALGQGTLETLFC